jgi:hypothetical protein
MQRIAQLGDEETQGLSRYELWLRKELGDLSENECT